MALSVLDANVQMRPVIYRVDYNVPIKDGLVLDDYRIRATVPTLDYLIKNGARVIILSHLGRPGGRYDEAFSLKPVALHLMSYFKDAQIQFTEAVVGPEILEAVAKMQPGSVLFLGNVRYYPGEEANDFHFAKQLAELAELYVSDAFGEMHRETATITQLPKLLESYAGVLLQHELDGLRRLRTHPHHPYTALLGGAKLETKVKLVKAMLERADYILVGGAMANTFCKAAGQDVGASFVEDDQLPIAKEILAAANGKLVLPLDFVHDGDEKVWRNVDIGPKTIDLFKQYLGGSQEIFWNGTLGIAEQARFANGTKQIAQFLAAANGLTTVAGGDTAAFLEREKLIDKYAFVSTGGGSALAYVAGEELPGLTALQLS